MADQDPAALEAQLAELNRMYQIFYPIAFWVEAIVYGLYASLFVATCRIMLKKRPAETVASRVFLIVSILIFILATIHNITSISRLIRAYALIVRPPAAFVYFQYFTEWDNYAHLLLIAFCTWLGDILVIYRCFLIWRRNFWVIILPIVFLVGSIGTTFVNWHWFRHPEQFQLNQILPIFHITFPLNLAQNILTTGLIAFKIYMQHRATVRSGLQISAGLNLVGVIRIIVESAMVYTIETLVIIILFFLNHPAVVIVQHSLPPSIGIVFCLIAIRTHVARSDSMSQSGRNNNNNNNAGLYPSRDSFFPTWLSDNDPLAATSSRRNIHMGPITVTTVTERHLHDSVITPMSMSKGEREIELTMDVDMDDDLERGMITQPRKPEKVKS